MTLRLVNLVATSNLDCSDPLSLYFINSKLSHSKYNPAKFSGLSLKLPHLKTSVLLFSNAKLVILGAKSEDLIVQTIESVIKSLNHIGFKVNKSPLKIENSVYTVDFGFQIHLESLSDTSHTLFFDPEIFAGIHHKVPINRSTCVIFHTGRCNILGVKTRAEAEETLQYLQELLPKYRKMATQEQRIAKTLASKEFTEAAQDFLDEQDRTPSVPPLIRTNAMIPDKAPVKPMLKILFKKSEGKEKQPDENTEVDDVMEEVPEVEEEQEAEDSDSEEEEEEAEGDYAEEGEEAEEGSSAEQHTPPAEKPVKPVPKSKIVMGVHPALAGKKKTTIKISGKEVPMPPVLKKMVTKKQPVKKPKDETKAAKKQKIEAKPPPEKSTAMLKQTKEMAVLPPFHSTLSLFICQVCHGSVFLNRTFKQLSNESYNLNLTLCKQLVLKS